jgi:hypothetical protein
MPTKPTNRAISVAKRKLAPVPLASSPTKSDLVISLLSRPDGAAASELLSATGWQLQSLRAFTSGLRKRGHAIARSKENGDARYAISNPETRL